MAELATIARPYAEALFKASPNPADAAGWVSPLNELAAVAGNAQLREFAANPKVAAKQIFDLVTSVVQVPLTDALRNLLQTVIENDRLAVLPEIAAQYRALVSASSGVFEAVVHSAYAIEPAALGELVATLEKRFGRKLTARVVVEPELIGGVRVVVGDEVLDTSVKARLEQMKAALTA